MTTRRDFFKTLTAAGAAASIPSMGFSKPISNLLKTKNTSNLIWANLLHLSTNMWEDNPYVSDHSLLKDAVNAQDVYRDDYKYTNYKEACAWAMRAYRPYLINDDNTWDAILKNMADAGMNMVIIDLGDAIKYDSHPEIAIKNAWSIDKLKAELQKIRNLGLEPIPKLNFAASHDIWLGEYSRMLSTQKYYSVCKDLINEAIELFDNPRFLHLGMDEETAKHQRRYDYVVIRQNDQWWKDFYFFVDETEKRGVRPWIWSDYGWRQPELFFKKMPKSVLQSNWYYDTEFDLSKMNEPASTYLKFYDDLEKYGYDQVPTGGNWTNDTNMEDTVRYCKRVVNPDRLLGFMTAPWLPNMDICLGRHTEAIDQIKNAKKKYY